MASFEVTTEVLGGRGERRSTLDPSLGEKPTVLGSSKWKSRLSRSESLEEEELMMS